MASTGIRSVMRRTSVSSIRSHIAKSRVASAPSSPSFSSKGSPFPSPNRRFAAISRSPVELGCLSGSSMYPLHSAVATARLTSRLSMTSRCYRDLSQGTLCRTYPGL